MDYITALLLSAIVLIFLVSLTLGNVLYGMSSKRRALRKLSDLRTRVEVAKTWVESEPTSATAKVAYKGAVRALESFEAGLTGKYHPWVIVCHLVECAEELAISAQIDAQHHKRFPPRDER